MFDLIGYTLYTRYACKNISISKFGLIFFNNSVSIVLLIPIAYYVGDMDSIVAHIDTLSSPSFLAYNFLAGFFGFYLSVSALWCVGATSATTLAILGSMNKIPITLLGFLLFPESAVITNQGISFMMLSVVGGIVYTYSKLKSDLK